MPLRSSPHAALKLAVTLAIVDGDQGRRPATLPAFRGFPHIRFHQELRGDATGVGSVSRRYL